MTPNEKPEPEVMKGIIENILALYLTKIAVLRKIAIKKGGTPEAIKKADLQVEIAKRKNESLGYGEQWAEAVAKVARDTTSIEEDEASRRVPEADSSDETESTRALLQAVTLTSSVSGCQ
ncbi:hypothetical protein LTR10_006699 [Elasticomyces elasticus]|nr:hypothetical protein LTR10_006699 [Elasticomyces elasticus]KAK4972899.1 hypothetical protein LTR42_006193 [Elasticomyces elasticus]